MKYDYDYIIIGSGFGGSVSALRLSEKGYRVLVVEQGKWYQSEDFAKTNWNLKKWLWIPLFRFFGIMKITIFRHIGVLSGTGVGGGSLVYANTLPIPKTRFYNTGSWNTLNNWEEVLKPYYQIAKKMLGVTKTPKLFEGDFELQQLAKEMKIEDQFESTDVGVFFGNQGKSVKDPYFEGNGPDRKGCIYCGACMTGCRHNAKNSLDKNYLYLAQQNDAKILAEHKVYNVIPLNLEDGSTGYRIDIQSSTKFIKKKLSYISKGVIFSGGVLGTIKLLLNLKKKTLPQLSERLGYDIRTNNETLISVSKLDRNSNVSRGVAISSILHTDENTHLEVVRYGEGSNFWKYLHLPYATGRNMLTRIFNMFVALFGSLASYCKIYMTKSWSKSTVVLLFMQTIDSTLCFKRNRFGRMISSISHGRKPTPFIPESIELTKLYSRISKSKTTSFILESIAGIPSTAHILGGAVMGSNAQSGVIDKYNRVFGYKNMFIIDGSMISANPGVNPSLSITAIAEHAMDHIESKSDKKTALKNF